MSSSLCLRCLSRPSTRTITPNFLPTLTSTTTTTAHSFSTSSTTSADITTVFGGHQRGKIKVVSPKMKKKQNHKLTRGSVPRPGERKAFRKRIQLSNNNALVVRGLSKLSPATMADSSSAGTVLSVPDELVDQLRASKAFKATQSWGLFHSPHVLSRAETVEVVNKMNDAAQKKATARLVITGDRLSGKSLLLLHAMANAHLKDWLVINAPEGQDLTNAVTDYGPIPNTDPVQWRQPQYVLDLMQGMRKASSSVLGKLLTTKTYEHLAAGVRADVPLTTLIDSAKDLDTAWPVWEALWAELTVEGHGRPPILLTLDSMGHIMRDSLYRSPSFEIIHSHDLAFIRTFTDVMSGAITLPNGGAVIMATSGNNHPTHPSVKLALSQRLAEQRGEDVPQKHPYGKGYDARVEAVLASVEVMDLKGIDKAGARALMEYWAASGLVRATIDERIVADQWTMAGSGIVGEMERMTIRNAIRT